MAKALEGYRTKAKNLLHGAASEIKNAEALKGWLTRQASKEFASLSSSVRGVSGRPVAKYLLHDVSKAIFDELSKSTADSNFNKAVSEGRISIDTIADSLADTGINDMMDYQEWSKAREAEIETKWEGTAVRPADRSKKKLPRGVRTDLRRLEKMIQKAEGRVPKEARQAIKAYMRDRGIDPGGVKEGQDRIKEIQEELKKTGTAYNYEDVQRRAGEILLRQEAEQKMRDLPADEVEYLESLPEAFKYEKEDSLKGHGAMGVLVDTIVDEKQKKPWPDLLKRIKREAKDDTQYKQGVSMMASRILRATKAAQGVEEVKEKAIQSIGLGGVQPVTQRELFLEDAPSQLIYQDEAEDKDDDFKWVMNQTFSAPLKEKKKKKARKRSRRSRK